MLQHEVSSFQVAYLQSGYLKIVWWYSLVLLRL